MVLLKITNDVLMAADQGVVTVIVLLDYSAAFDTVHHATALDILEKSLESHHPVYSGSVAIYLDVHSLSQPTARHLMSST